MNDYKTQQSSKFWKTTAILLAVFTVVLILAFVIQAFLFSPMRVDGTSMTPNYSDGSVIFIQKSLYSVSFGDVVVFEDPRYPDDPDAIPLMKRVIGLGGDTVELKNFSSGGLFAKGDVYVNDKYIDDYRLFGIDNHITAPTEFKWKWVVPEGHVFVLGDNRLDSLDSRKFGTVPLSTVKGLVLTKSTS